MRRALLFSTALILSFTTVTEAADLGISAPVVAPLPALSWTGIYFGIGGGAAWGNDEYTWNQDATLAAVAAQMQNPGTLPRLGSTQGSLPISGGFFGGQLGGNWQIGWAVLGLQTDAHWADIDGHGSCFDAGALATAGVSFPCNDKITSFGTVTGRVGAAVDRALIYAKGGWAWAHEQHSLNPTAPFNVMGGNNSLVSITGASSSQWRSGWTFGAGIEYAFAPHWSAFLEYNYFDFGSWGANSTHLVSLPGNIPPSLVIPIQADATGHFSAVKVGLNYSFDWLITPVGNHRL